MAETNICGDRKETLLLPKECKCDLPYSSPNKSSIQFMAIYTFYESLNTRLWHNRLCKENRNKLKQ